LKENDSVKKYLAEFIGTFVLVLFGCGTACVVGCQTRAGYLATALSFGLVIVAMAYSIGNISGCHINPAVSLAVYLSKKMTLEDFIGYVIAQFLGATAGAGVLAYLVGRKSGLGINSIANVGWGKSFIIEVILTFVFVLVILGVTSKDSFSSVAGVVIGLSLTLVHLLGIKFTGTSVNPARSFGPSVIVGGDQLKSLWVFIVAPLVGGALAAFCYKFLSEKSSK
jgi:MIP family channel proteins